MDLGDYRVGDRVEVKVGQAWHSGTVLRELDAIGVVAVDIDEASVHALVSSSAGIRPLVEDERQLEVGAQVIMSGPNGARWTGQIAEANAGKLTILLAGLDSQTVVVSKDSCQRA